jgi:hypothetical protein
MSLAEQFARTLVPAFTDPNVRHLRNHSDKIIACITGVDLSQNLHPNLEFQEQIRREMEEQRDKARIGQANAVQYRFSPPRDVTVKGGPEAIVLSGHIDRIPISPR